MKNYTVKFVSGMAAPTDIRSLRVGALDTWEMQIFENEEFKKALRPKMGTSHILEAALASLFGKHGWTPREVVYANKESMKRFVNTIGGALAKTLNDNEWYKDPELTYIAVVEFLKSLKIELTPYSKFIEKPKNLDFGDAIKAAKAGKKLARRGWNGNGMYSVYMPGYPDGIEVNAITQKQHGLKEGSKLVYRPYLQLYTAQKDVAMWSPSTSDVLADDWYIVEEVLAGNLRGK